MVYEQNNDILAVSLKYASN